MATGGKADFEKVRDETFDFLCSGCKKKNKNVEADTFCMECYDYYCSTCVKFHEDFPALSFHKILDKGRFQPGSSVKFPEVLIDKCQQHDHKPVDMFCRQHDVVGCSTCMEVHHSNCADKFYISDFVKTNNESCSSKAIEQKLESLSESLKDVEKALKREKESLQNCWRISITKISKLRLEVNQLLDELEKKTILEFDTTFNKLTGIIEDEMDQVKKVAKEVNVAEANLKLAAGNASQLFVGIKKASEVASKAEIKVTVRERNKNPPIVDFCAYEILLSLLHEIQTLGTVSQGDNKRHSSTSAYKNKKRADQGSKTSNQQFPLVQMKNKRNCSIKVASDLSTCDIISACTLEDGTVILADNENRKLKRLDHNLKVQDYCEVPAYPVQVCGISNQQVAVTCWKEQKVQIVSVGKTMKRTKHISTNFECTGLTYADGKLYVSGRTAIYAYSVIGDKLQILGQLSSDKALFSNIRSLAVSRDKSKIYVTDAKNGLIVLDSNGLLIVKSNSHGLKGAKYVCLYKNGYVLVCGNKSTNVMLSSPAGEKMCEVLKSYKQLRTVCCIENCSKVIVSYLSQEEIEVFDIA